MSSGRAHWTLIARALTVTGAVMTVASTAQGSGCAMPASARALSSFPPSC
jgi:hypothetical protein